ncbi:MAG: phosphatase PAP2 family protein [Hydrogenophaga sp.]|uniref:phosphatase PAP2 family protein n=1 Tax=Hydrogenophaga sp. TaxID=1904254 RepID=UPI002627A463|nr:phosphatase PAP2 family protein [Hydrogenophaga sp.]MDM7944293.1 phosphatase PAP2 family protein [Hydrogenophaga sp.]
MEPTVGTPSEPTTWGRRPFDVWLFRRMGAGHGARAGWLPVACAVAQHSWIVLLPTLMLMTLGLQGGGWTALQCLGVATLAQVLSKQCAARWAAPRPFALGLSQNHLGHGPRAGLPSTHAAVMGAVVGFMAVAAPTHPLLALLGATALATAWARVYAGAHFPGDVLLGLSMGGSLGWAGAMLFGPA